MSFPVSLSLQLYPILRTCDPHSSCSARGGGLPRAASPIFLPRLVGGNRGQSENPFTSYEPHRSPPCQLGSGNSLASSGRFVHIIMFLCLNIYTSHSPRLIRQPVSPTGFNNITSVMCMHHSCSKHRAAKTRPSNNVDAKLSNFMSRSSFSSAYFN